MAKEISKEQTKHIAKLNNLTLSDEEVEKLSQMLTDTLDYIDVLDELDTSNVQETFQVTGATNVFLEKGIKTTLSREETFQNVSDNEYGLFIAEAVFDRD